MKIFRRFIIVAFLVTCGIYAYYTRMVLGKIDTTAPVISMDSDAIEVSIEATNEDLLQGVTAEDDVDGDVSDSLMVESQTMFTSRGTFEISIVAFDKTGNIAEVTRQVTYMDYTSPKLEILEPLRFSENDNSVDILGKVDATDCIEGDIGSRIKFVTQEDFWYGNVGEYVLALQVTNSRGDTEKQEVSFEVLSESDFSDPYPILSSYLVYTKVGQKIARGKMLIGVQAGNSQYLFEDMEDEENPRYTSSDVSIKGDIDFDTPGIYPVVYTYYEKKTVDDEEKKEAKGHCTLYVVVEE